MRNSPGKINKQQGMAVLAISIILLVLITLISSYLSRSVLLEQKLVNNDKRAKEAFEAAESGALMTMEQLRANTYYSQDSDNNQHAGNNDVDGDGVNDSNLITFNQTQALVSVKEEDNGGRNFYTITSTGSQSDFSASRTVEVKMQSLSPLPNIPDNPMSARSTVYFDGNGTVRNLEGHSTIWSGSNVRLKHNATEKTYVADPASINYPGCMDTRLTDPCGQALSSDGTTVGLDVIEYDSDLANLTDTDLFMNTFGLTPEIYRETMVTKDCSDFACASSDTEGQVIWYEGDAGSGPGATFGSADEPAIVIINGDYLRNNINVYGLLFVMGDFDTKGNSTIKGAVIVGGNASETGSVYIDYYSELLNRAASIDVNTTEAGSWKDF